MARRRVRRKSKQNYARLPFPAFAANVLVVAMMIGLSFMWTCSRCDALGKAIKKNEAALEYARKCYVNEQDRWSLLTSPANLERAIMQYDLAMIMPGEDQIIRVRYQGSNRGAVAYRF